MGRIYLQSGLALAFNPLLMLIPVHSKNSEYRDFLSAENLAETRDLIFSSALDTPGPAQCLGSSRCQQTFI